MLFLLFIFVTHNYCPTCREAGKGDDPCVNNEKPCNICSCFTEEQLIKIKHRRRFVRKQKVSDTCNTSKDDVLDLLTDDMEAFSGSQVDLEGTAVKLFSSPPCPQLLRLESLSLRTPLTVPPTPGTALQNTIESKLEKSLGNQFNIQLQQQMGVFQVSMLEAMKSLKEEMQSMKKASKAEVDKTSTSTSKAGPSKHSDPLIHLNPWPSDHSDAQPMEMDFSGPSLPPRFTKMYSPIMAPSTRTFNPNTQILNPNTRNNLKGRVLLEPRNTRTKRNTRFRQNTIHSLHLQTRISPLSLLKSLLSMNRLLLSKTNNRITQTQSFTGT